MKKIYKISGIILIVILISAVLFVLNYHPYFIYKKEIELSRNFWISLINNKILTLDKNVILSERFTKDKENAIQFFKIWFHEFSPKNPDINLLEFKNAGLIVSDMDKSIDSKNISISFKYGNESQRLQMTIIHKGDSIYLNPHLSLDNCIWDPDKNNDGKLDDLDIQIIKSEK